uniref:Uncharacterized protein n=1 Tax=Tanacetum cinerariifolium TaxID=118510 RepID=A0A6L2MJE2_TANCI|nr:hypothetical protein [Tanacetum cinerariifolium]
MLLACSCSAIIDSKSKSKSPGSAGASSAQTSSTTAPASNPNSITDTPSQAGLDDVVGDNRQEDVDFFRPTAAVRYDATENQLSTDTSLQRRILKHIA